jgi:diguanylate cyclase (GGDEF)-like protein
MRNSPLALFSGIGRHVALVVIACGLVVLALGLLLQAGKQQRQYRAMHQQQLQQAAEQSARLVRSRIDSAALLLSMQIDAASRGKGAGPLVLAQLRRVPLFSSVAIMPAAANSFEQGQRRFTLVAHAREALESGGTVLLGARDAAGAGRLYLLRSTGDPEYPLWVLVELRSDWLWSTLGEQSTKARLAVFDSRGDQHFSSQAGSAEIATHVSSRLEGLPASGASSEIAWNESGEAWVGAMSRINSGNVVSDVALAMVAMERDRPWSVAFFSALRTQVTLVPLVLLLAAWLAHDFAGRLLTPLRQLRRAVAQLPDRRVPVASDPGHFAEVKQLVDAYNRSAEAIETQNGMRRVLDELDALLLPGGDHESVIDQVLARVRTITRANNVGLTLVDPGYAGYGRLFAVSAQGGAPVNRVMLDPAMVATLRDAFEGLTIARIEQGRHSFLEPLHEAGSAFFWVWPVMASDELAAILAVGYTEAPRLAARIADTGTLCAQRLGLALSNNARAERLYRQAHFDPLTQLANRQLFRDQLQRELTTARETGNGGALLYIDLDHFKRVNDSFGHEAGDQLLAIVAQRLQGCIKDGDVAARLGGDEFTVILRHVADHAAAAAVTDRILAAMRQPMWLGGRDHHVQASIGVTLYPQDGAEIDELLHHADLAMYRAKDLGRSGAVFYSAKMDTRATRIADSGLYRAMKHREFSLYYQPQYDVKDGTLVGIEALLRWYRPREGMVAPSEFIPAAEESGIIVDLGGWVIEAACTQVAAWRDAGVKVPRVAVNLSTQQLRDPGLVPAVRRQLERHHLGADAIEFEMNEAALTDAESAPAIHALSQFGVRLTLDDFGTGSTALANLRRYPVSAVKIDRSFVEQLMDSPSAAALASTIIVMAHGLQKQVIAEGVESIEQLEYLREHRCDMAQGFFLARPLSASDMTEMLLGLHGQRRNGRSAIA